MSDFTDLFLLLCALLTLLAVAFVALPLWLARRGAADDAETDYAEANIALFHERKQELEADCAIGEITPEELDALLVELQKSLLADVEPGDAPTPVKPSGASSTVILSEAKRSRRIHSPTWHPTRLLAPLSLAILLPLAAWLMYQQWGHLQDVELMDQFERTVQNGNDTETARELLFSLGQEVQENPERPWAWYFLGENFSTLGMFDAANSAYRQAAERLRDDEEKALALGRVALTAYIMEQLQITSEVRLLIDETLALNPDEANVLQLLASDAEEREDYDAAIGYWRRLSQLNPDSQTARENIANLQRLRAGDTAAGPAIEVAVAIAAGLPLNPELRVFVAARNAAVEGMPPLAVADLTVADLPAKIRLDDSLAVGPFKLSSAESVYISALVSQSGTANRATGDYYAETEAFPLESPPEPLELLISATVP